MYFSGTERQRSPQEVREEALTHMQTFFTAERSAFQLPQAFDVINHAFPSDEQLATYALGLHANSRVVASAQAKAYERPTVAKILADSVAPEDTIFGNDICKIIYSDEPAGKAPFSQITPFQVGQFLRIPDLRTMRVPYPWGMKSPAWEVLAKTTPDAIIRGLKQHADTIGNKHTELDIFHAGVRLVCTKRERTSRALVATAPSRIQRAHQVLKKSGHFYPHGVAIISGALERGNHIEAWDEWCKLATQTDLEAKETQHKLPSDNRQILHEDGVTLAMRNKHHNAALDIIEDAIEPYTFTGGRSGDSQLKIYRPPWQESSPVLLGALVTLSLDSLAGKDAHN